MDHSVAFIFSGFVVGFIVGLTGVGGGSLMTPILIFGFGIKPALAVGTDLLFAAFTKLGGSVRLTLSKAIEWRIVGALSLGSVPATLITLYVLKQIGHDGAAVQQVITTTLGVALVLTALATFYKAQFGKRRPASVTSVSVSDSTRVLHPLVPIFFGALIGLLITLTSVGAGAIGVIVLMLLYPHLPLSRVVAVDIAYAIPITLIAGMGHAWIGTVNWPLLGLLLVGSLPGIWLGTRLHSRWSDKVLRTLLSFLIAYAGYKLLTR